MSKAGKRGSDSHSGILRSKEYQKPKKSKKWIMRDTAFKGAHTNLGEICFDIKLGGRTDQFNTTLISISNYAWKN